MARDRRIDRGFIALYVVLTALLMSPLWSSGFTHSTVWPEGDASISIWANGFIAHFWTWNSTPFFSSSVFSPHGLNLLANTTGFGAGLLLVPVTWLLGPVASFNLELFALPVMSAVAMQWALRRLVPSSVGRGVAGLIWGFSPFAMEALYWGWPNFLYLVTPPILLWVSSELLSSRLSARRLGVVTGACLSAQLLVGGEVAAICIVVMSVVVAKITVVSLCRRRWPGELRLPRLGRFIGWTALSSLPLAVPTGLYALMGPAHVTAWVWPERLFKVTTPMSLLWSSPVAAGAFHPGWNPVYPSHFYVGPILLIAAIVVVVLHRRALTAVMGLVGAVGVWLIGGTSALLHPFGLLWNLPVVHNVVVGRYVLALWLAIAVLLAVGISLLEERVAARGWRSSARYGAIAIAAVLVVAAPADAIVTAGPWHSQAPRVDGGLRWVARHEPATPVVMAFPFFESSAAMIQQVSEHLPIRLLGGWGPQNGYSPAEMPAVNDLLYLSEVSMFQLTSEQLRQIAAFLSRHGVTDIVVPVHIRRPLNRGYLEPFQMVVALSEIYGSPQVVAGDWHWNLRVHRLQGTPIVLSERRWQYCAWGLGRVNPRAVGNCVATSGREVSRPLR